ncbi:MAG: NAD-binding protein [Pseudomonadota bacterium]
MFSSHRSAAVIGLGTFGISIARALTEGGTRVLGIDCDHTLVDRFHAEFDNTICADARDPRALRECAMDDQDMVIIAIGSDFEASLKAAYNAKTLGAKIVHAKALSEPHSDMLRAVGVKTVFMPEVEGGQIAARNLLGERD